jgi:hypothetical protein
MVWIPGGEFSMGAQDPPDLNDAVGMQATTDSRPVHRVFVDVVSAHLRRTDQGRSPEDELEWQQAEMARTIINGMLNLYSLISREANHPS